MSNREKIEGWLKDWEISFTEEEPANESYDWVISFKPSPSFRTVVAQKAVDYSWIQLECSLALVDDHLKTLAALDEATREEFMHDFRIQMASLPVGYTISLDEQTGLMTRITLGLNVLEDPLQRAGFFRRHHQIQSAAQIAVLMIQKMARLKGWE